MNEPPTGKEPALKAPSWLLAGGLHGLARDLEMDATMEVGEKYSACLRQEDDNK